MIVIVKIANITKKQILRDNYKNPIVGEFIHCTSVILRNLAVEDGSESESDAVEDNSWKKSNKKTPKH